MKIRRLIKFKSQCKSNKINTIKIIFYIEFLNKIRNEIKFESKEDLIKQIENDKEVCIKLIDSFKEKYEV